jgi:uncharacterized repeat protein (TIGR01451 family)
MRTAAGSGGRLGRRMRADVIAVLALGALAAGVATTAEAVGKRIQPGGTKCPEMQVIQPVATGTYAITFGSEAGSISLVVRNTTGGPVVDFTTDGPTHLVDRVLVKRGDGANHFDYRPDGVTAGTGLHAPKNPATGKYHVPSYLCVATRLKPPPPVDVCPNIEGVQTVVPPGMIKDASGNCVTPPPPPPTDVCPNIEGVQTVVPPGMIKDASGNCVTPPPPPLDVCPNIPGTQETVPPGMIKDASGNCVTPPSPPPAIDLSIAKDDSADPVSAGRNVLYTVTVTNTSSVKATGVVVTDTLPAGLTILSVRASQGSCTTAGRTITCQLGGLPARSKAVVKVLVRTTAPGVVTNHARVSGNEPDPTPANNTTAENTRIVAPFQPPSAGCDSVTVGRRTILVGRATTLRIFVKSNGRGRANERVRITGAGIDKSARTNRLGIAVISVRATRPGIVSIRVTGESCSRRIGAIGGGQPDLTG